jgi:hypothetical protein
VVLFHFLEALLFLFLFFLLPLARGGIDSGGGTGQIGSWSNWSSIGEPFQTNTVSIGSYVNQTGQIQILHALANPPSNPKVSDPVFLELTASTALVQGEVTGDGGVAIIERGLVYSRSALNANPTLNGEGVAKVSIPGGVGGFSIPLAGLDDGTT